MPRQLPMALALVHQSVGADFIFSPMFNTFQGSWLVSEDHGSSSVIHDPNPFSDSRICDL